MEEQKPTGSSTVPLTVPTTAQDSSTEVYEPNLRFPTPQGNPRVARWVSSSTHDIMPSSTNEPSNLAESTYELINADDSSQDGLTNDDMSQSAGGDDANDGTYVSHGFRAFESSDYNTESEDDGDHGVSSNEPTTNEPIAASLASVLQPSPDFTPRASTYVTPRCIELIQDGAVEKGNATRFKHVVKVINDKESVDAAKRFRFATPSSKLAVTLRQTQSHNCLKTDEALRILYVGDRAARWDIVTKISRAITCSASPDYRKGQTMYPGSQHVFNIVPITNFGSSKNREVELMETSDYRIDVQTCVMAEEVPVERTFLHKNPVYSLIVEEGSHVKRYMSTLGLTGSAIQPAWQLPHVAIFYCSSKDNQKVQSTRNATWDFAARHAIPCIFVAEDECDTQKLIGHWASHITDDVPHISLESCEPLGKAPQKRLPIDLRSFLNIDDAQMNRNLAFLTGLEQTNAMTKASVTSSKAAQDRPQLMTLWYLSQVKKLSQHVMAWISQAVMSVRRDSRILASLLVTIATVMVCTSLRPSISTSVSEGRPTPHPLPGLSAASPTTMPSAHVVTSISTAYTTVTVSHTSTRVLRVTSTETAPAFAGFLPEKTQSVVAATSSPGSVCSVVMYSPNEVLIMMPPAKKVTWLAKGAIEVNISRGSTPIKSRLSTVDEGVLVAISEDDAYSILNVSVVTSKRPKINETFAVDFGTSRFAQLYATGMELWRDGAERVAISGTEAGAFVRSSAFSVSHFVLVKSDEEMARLANVTNSLKHSGAVAQNITLHYSHVLIDQLHSSWKSLSPAPYGTKVGDLLAAKLKEVSEDAQLTLLQAQVSSRILWLRWLGTSSAAESYAQKAAMFLHEKQALRQRSERSKGQDGADRWTVSGVVSYFAKQPEASREEAARKGFWW